MPAEDILSGVVFFVAQCLHETLRNQALTPTERDEFLTDFCQQLQSNIRVLEDT
jgi:hypothetical protein